jgi:hypothetical protein
MSDKTRALSEEEVDERVIAEADDDSAWEKPVKVRRSHASAAPRTYASRHKAGGHEKPPPSSRSTSKVKG